MGSDGWLKANKACVMKCNELSFLFSLQTWTCPMANMSNVYVQCWIFNNNLKLWLVISWYKSLDLKAVYYGTYFSDTLDISWEYGVGKFEWLANESQLRCPYYESVIVLLFLSQFEAKLLKFHWGIFMMIFV